MCVDVHVCVWIWMDVHLVTTVYCQTTDGSHHEPYNQCPLCPIAGTPSEKEAVLKALGRKFLKIFPSLNNICFTIVQSYAGECHEFVENITSFHIGGLDVEIRDRCRSIANVTY